MYVQCNFLAFYLVSLSLTKQIWGDTLSSHRQYCVYLVTDVLLTPNKLCRLQLWLWQVIYTFFPGSWVNKLNDLNGIEKNYEIALCILKEGQRKSGTVDYKKLMVEVLKWDLACDWHVDNLAGVKCLVPMVYYTCACTIRMNWSS